MSSDFHVTLALLHSGYCPLCGGSLKDAHCRDCDVAWSIQGVHDRVPEDGTVIGMGPMLVASRKLTDQETRRIYDRREGEA